MMVIIRAAGCPLDQIGRMKSAVYSGNPGLRMELKPGQLRAGRPNHIVVMDPVWVALTASLTIDHERRTCCNCGTWLRRWVLTWHIGRKRYFTNLCSPMQKCLLSPQEPKVKYSIMPAPFINLYVSYFKGRKWVLWSELCWRSGWCRDRAARGHLLLSLSGRKMAPLVSVLTIEYNPKRHLPTPYPTLTARSRWFSTLDLLSGYWQVKVKWGLAKNSILYDWGTVWVSCDAIQVVQHPGHLSAPDRSGPDRPPVSQCLVYLDDIIIIGWTFKEHLDNLRLVVEQLRESGLKLNPHNSSLC